MDGCRSGKSTARKHTTNTLPRVEVFCMKHVVYVFIRKGRFRGFTPLSLQHTQGQVVTTLFHTSEISLTPTMPAKIFSYWQRNKTVPSRTTLVVPEGYKKAVSMCRSHLAATPQRPEVFHVTFQRFRLLLARRSQPLGRLRSSAHQRGALAMTDKTNGSAKPQLVWVYAHYVGLTGCVWFNSD